MGITIKDIYIENGTTTYLSDVEFPSTDGNNITVRTIVMNDSASFHSIALFDASSLIPISHENIAPEGGPEFASKSEYSVEGSIITETFTENANPQLVGQSLDCPLNEFGMLNRISYAPLLQAIAQLEHKAPNFYKIMKNRLTELQKIIGTDNKPAAKPSVEVA